MNSFDYSDTLWDIFSNDSKLVELLGIDTEDESSYALKLRQEDVVPEEYDVDNFPFIAFYFSEANITRNDYMNKGLLRIDIYSHTRDAVKHIRERIVELVHENVDERIRSEGQYSSGVRNVYKYRLEFTPLIFT